MKTFLTIALSLLLAGCASAMPPTHKPLQVVVTVPSGTPATANVNIYQAQQSDTNWPSYTTVKIIGTQAAMPIVGTPAELYTATVTNNGNESDYSIIVTNLVAPAATIK